MARKDKGKLKINAARGRMPVLQYLPPQELAVDPAYQRSAESEASQQLIRSIAAHWNWDLCQPLVVSQRGDAGMYVIDGQHRLLGALLRGDIGQLPCVVVRYDGAAQEAAAFVKLNQLRRALSGLEIFRAAVASGEQEALAIVAALAKAGLRVAPHTNNASWKPGMVGNVTGIRKAWQSYGPAVCGRAMQVLARGFAGQVLNYAGTIWPGIAALTDRSGARSIDELAAFMQSRSQMEWRNGIMLARSADPNLNFERAAVHYVLCMWDKYTGAAAGRDAQAQRRTQREARFLPGDDGKAWCTQCERRTARGEMLACKSRFCAFGAPIVPEQGGGILANRLDDA